MHLVGYLYEDHHDARSLENKVLHESLIWDQQLVSWVKDKDRTRVGEIAAQNIKEEEEWSRGGVQETTGVANFK
jgi:hypothetical protein